MKQIYRCCIKTLSPLHIGCDEVYEPMGFVVDETKRDLISFDPITFIGRLNHGEKEKFSAICSKGTVESILEIYKFLKGKPADGKAVQLCPGFVEHYNKTLAISDKDKQRVQQELNRFKVERTSFLPIDQRPYIPGSAIKGALRTAYLNTMAKMKKVPTPRGKSAAKDLEKTLLDGGAFETDPFRLVKISDFRPIGEIRTKIVYAVNEKKKPSKFEARGPYQILEVVQPGALFEGEIAVDTPQTKECIKTPVSIQKLLDSCTQFFRKEKKREDDALNQIQISGVQVSENEDAVLIRLGRHSGAESMTIEGHRNIKIMTGRGQRDRYENHATTFWLASDEQKPTVKENLHPFGWAEMGKVNAFLAKEFKEKKKGWEDRIKQSLKFIPEETIFRAAIKKEIKKGATLTKEKEPVVKVTVSPIEMMIRELDLVKANDMGRIGTIIQKIDTLETDEDKGKVAIAIRDKIGAKAFKKHKKRDYLGELIKKVITEKDK
ncbi:MAG: type III-A CRISPR-associated RAMP protein Csm5 [Proteobacteria bacterium]|nr:type III-A CRISPR-associated RAMP protein Csm5 [Pseudomonadota bacterium]